MSDPNTGPNKTTQKFFDVVSPGHSAPSASSKPIIVSNRPQQPDPMMSRPQPKDSTSTSQNADQLPVEPTPTASLDKLQLSNTAQQAASHHRLRKMVPLLIGILVLFVIADLLVDANIIHTSVTPLTNFFHHH